MYNYEWDNETGGYILLSTASKFSKEPRPVYYKELDILGFEKFWKYEKDDSFPYMWAESNSYIYKGRVVAKTKGGSLYTAPELDVMDLSPEGKGNPLQFVNIDLMIEKNREIMDSLVNQTIKNLYNTYTKYQKKVDVFYVAYSGGKDSIALLDIVQRTLPHNSFIVLFGDTKMEFSDTYDVVEATKKMCMDNNIDFYTAKSHMEIDDSWRIFGPPSQTLRWCCSVHKTTPQIIKIREILGKENFTGMAFIGVRGDESISRSTYDYVSLGEKHKGQYSCNPILDWNSAELFLYTYMNNLIFNEAYKKGNSRVGCLVCPMAAFKNEYMKTASYKKETSKYFQIIKDCNGKDFESDAAFVEYLELGGWKARRNGRELKPKVNNYKDYLENKKIVIEMSNPTNDWKQWMKTIGKLIFLEEKSRAGKEFYKIFNKNKEYIFTIEKNDKCLYKISIDESYRKVSPTFIKLFKQVFKKSTLCIGCRECEADCKRGCITFVEGKVNISDNCIGCSECHKVDTGCLIYKSTALPKGEYKMGKFKSLNCYSNHGPKQEWIDSYFALKDDFKTENELGSNMFDFFKRFLKDAKLMDDKNNFSYFASIIDKIGYKENSAWGLILSNLVYTPQINWIVKNLEFSTLYCREQIISMLEESEVKEVAAKQMLLAYKRLMELKLKDVGFGIVNLEKNKIVSFSRSIWKEPNQLVLLYNLYKFAEACGDYYQFTLTRLMNFRIESDGVSPAQIFGIDRDKMEQILTGLSINYPDFISATFTLDLDNITLRNDRTSLDVLKLF